MPALAQTCWACPTCAFLLQQPGTFPHCGAQPRDVQLIADVALWRQSLTQAWQDHIDFTIPLEFRLVDPDPVDEHDDVATHLILLQRSRPDTRSLLISVLDNTIWNAFPRRWALRGSSDPTGGELIALMGYHHICSDDAVQCRIWCHGQEIGYDEEHSMLQLDNRHFASPVDCHLQHGRERLTHEIVAHAHGPCHVDDSDFGS